MHLCLKASFAPSACPPGPARLWLFRSQRPARSGLSFAPSARPAHTAYAIDFDNIDDTDIDTFIARRPDGLALDKEEKSCVFLEYTRAMDTNED